MKNDSRLIIEKVASGLERVRQGVPLVHHLTNQVVMNDCANVTLHIGGSPVMAHAPEEVEEMVSLAGSLVLNIGTLSQGLVESMVRAGKEANRRGIPVLLDPVGAGATAMRTRAARRVLEEVQVSIIKGNAGEVSVLAGIKAVVRGVDSVGISGDAREVVESLAREWGCCVAMTGPEDLVSRGGRTLVVKNGHRLLAGLTGTGCMAGSLVAAFAAVVQDPFLAALAGLVCFGVAAERAAEGAGVRGPASFKVNLLDEVSRLEGGTIREMARVHEV